MLLYMSYYVLGKLRNRQAVPHTVQIADRKDFWGDSTPPLIALDVKRFHLIAYT